MMKTEIIQKKITRLIRSDTAHSVFGADTHQYRNNLPLREADVLAYESANGIRLPEEYRAYLTQIADGGMGPFCGLLALLDNNGNHTDPSKPFPFDRDHPLSLMALYEKGHLEADEHLDALSVSYEDANNGIVYLSHEGCGMYSILVVNGVEYGNVWYVDFANELGAFPLLHPQTGEPLGFLNWFELWLDKALAQVEDHGDGLSGYAQFIPGTWVAERPPNPLYIDDEAEYERLKLDLAQGNPLENRDIERLAFMLDDWCGTHCVGDEDLDSAALELNLLFACFAALPASETVREMLCSSALAYIDLAGESEEFPAALDCIAKLRRIQVSEPLKSTFAHVCANGMVLTIINYLNSEDVLLHDALALHGELEELVRPYADCDPFLSAMLAWVKRIFVWHCAREHDEAGMQSGLAGLVALLGEYPENALLAGEYACACSICFDEYLSHGDREKAYGAMLPELERMVRVYGERYRAYQELTLEYHFPTYSPDCLDDLLTDAISDIAAYDTEKNNLEGVLDCQSRLADIPYLPEAEPVYLEVRRQLLSNLALLHGRTGDYPEAVQCIRQLRELVTENEGASALADALYNLIAHCATDNPIAYQAQIQFLLSELAALAASTDDIHEHTRYVMALYNLSAQLENAGIPHQSTWELVYSYSMEHTIDDSMACTIAQEEKSLIAGTDNLNTAWLHWERVRAICRHSAYGQNADMAQWLAAAHFNLLTVAINADAMPLADEMLQTLLRMPEYYNTREEIHREIVFWIAMGAFNLVTEYGDRSEITYAETIYASTEQLLLLYAQDTEIADLLSEMAMNLCIDLKNAGQRQKILEIHERIKKITTTGEAGKYLKQIRKIAKNK